MKKFVAVVMILSFTTVGFAADTSTTRDKTKRGAVIGAVAGSVLGAVVGNNTGSG